MDVKNRRLAAFEDEVKDFHPALRSIFRHLKTITQVEYTHGVNEKGADFVLTLNNETLGSIDYVGVIAKVGSLGKSAVRSLEEQIKDCQLERYTLGGKRRIKLNQIWIITNSTISTNAHEAIEHTFQGQKIEFIDCDRLIALIDKWFPNFWSEVPIEASSYFDRLKLQIDEDERRACLVPTAATLYIEQSVYHEQRKVGTTAWDQSSRTKIDLVADIAGNALVLVEADAGGGKSKLFRQTAKRLSSADIYNRYKLVPIMSSVRELFDNFACQPRQLVQTKMGFDVALLESD